MRLQKKNMIVHTDPTMRSILTNGSFSMLNTNEITMPFFCITKVSKDKMQICNMK